MNDTSKYLPLFISEATAHAEQLGGHLPALPSQKDSPEHLDELHRHAHSLRGMSAAMGFDEITQLARSVEGFLARLREGAVDLAPSLVHPLGEAEAQLLAMIEARGQGSILAGDSRLIEALDRALSDASRLPPRPPHE